ncbi:MAG TPA: hypothetical protein VIY73_08525 [Polyangiaceae bacterium]
MRRWIVATALCVAGAGCASAMERTDGMDTSVVPEEQRADYALFAQRCSKCHSLARPLNSGITDDGYWHMYVEKMRRQPGSGITEADTAPILRFLHWYSVDQLQRQQKGRDAG